MLSESLRDARVRLRAAAKTQQRLRSLQHGGILMKYNAGAGLLGRKSEKARMSWRKVVLNSTQTELRLQILECDGCSCKSTSAEVCIAGDASAVSLFLLPGRG